MDKPDWQNIRDRISAQMDPSLDLDDARLQLLIEETVARSAGECLLSLEERESYERQIFNSFRKLDVLQELLDDTDVTEVMVNGPGKIFYEKDGQLYTWEKESLSEQRILDMVQQIVGSVNRTVNESQPIADARLPDGSRVNVVLPPIALGGPYISIRRFPKTPMSFDRLIKIHSMSEEIALFLRSLVQAGYNIFCSGGTGAGKTSFLNALSEHIPSDQRIVLIEDSAELNMIAIENLVRLEARRENVNGALAVTIRDLIRTALRMRPDRIIVGECRGAEALDMLQAMNTGHDGSLSTGHANSSEDMLGRLETMVMMGMDLPAEAVRRQIASGIDIIVHMGRMRDRSRKVLHIAELDGIKDGRIRLHTLYRFKAEGQKEGQIAGTWIREGTLLHREKLNAAYLDGSAPDGEEG